MVPLVSHEAGDDGIKEIEADAQRKRLETINARALQYTTATLKQ